MSFSSIPNLKYYLLIVVGVLTLVLIAANTLPFSQSASNPKSFDRLPAFKIQPELWPLSVVNDIDISSIQAEAVILIDEANGEVLAERNSQIRLPMASTTKIMTAALALEFTDIKSVITIPEEALRGLPYDSALMGISPQEQYTVEELLYGLMLNSGNDAANALAIAVSGNIENFANLMNAKAEQLGLQNTNFTNPTGLDSQNHYSTAQDLAVIAHYARSFPVFNKIVSTSNIQLPHSSKHKQLYLENLNSMIGTYYGATGIKPGNTGNAGNCLVASASRNNTHLIGVLLNTPGRNTNMSMLFDLGFSR